MSSRGLVLLFLLGFFVLGSIPRTASAEDAVRVTVLPFSGAGGGAVRNGVVRALLEREDIELVPSSEARAAARSLGVSLDDASGRAATSLELSLSGVVGGRVANRRVAHTIIYGRDGEEIERVRAQGGNVAPLARAMERKTRTDVAAAILRLRWLARPTPEVTVEAGAPDLAPRATTEPPEASPSGASETFVNRPTPWLEAFSLALSMSLHGRSLRFTDDVNDALARYELKAAPGVGVHASLFPLRPFVRNAIAHLGFLGGADFVFVNGTDDVSESARFETEVRRWSVEMRYEIVLRRRHRIHAGVGVGEDRFALDRQDPVVPGDQQFPVLPSVSYRYFRPSLGARVWLSHDVYLVAEGGFRAVSDGGEIESESWFPRSESFGFDLSSYVAYRPGPFFELRGGMRYAHYVHDLRPEPGDLLVAGGAVDRRWSLDLSIVVLAPGTL